MSGFVLLDKRCVVFLYSVLKYARASCPDRLLYCVGRSRSFLHPSGRDSCNCEKACAYVDSQKQTRRRGLSLMSATVRYYPFLGHRAFLPPYLGVPVRSGEEGLELLPPDRARLAGRGPQL